jgi:ATP-dependent protease ClpP protease subunit
MTILSDSLAFAEGYLNANRTIILSSATNEEVMEKISNTLVMLETQEIKPITLLINSRGGTGGFYLQNVINSLRSEVNGLVIGRASSMAALILQMCNKRMMMPNSTLYFHHCGYSIPLERGYPYSLKKSDKDKIFKNIQTANDPQITLLMKRTGHSRKVIKELLRYGELYSYSIQPKEALKLNLIDEIVSDFKLFPPEFKGMKTSKKQ